MSKIDRRQQLIAFFSADLANATEFKNRHQPQYLDGRFLPPSWPRYFSEVFSQILRQFDEELTRQQSASAVILPNRPRLWKINGDELLFRELIIPGEDGLKWLASVAAAFVDMITRVDQQILPDGLGLRGCIWTAGFPIRNKEIKAPTGQTIPVIRALDTEGAIPDFDTGIMTYEDGNLIDYLGPDMDLGFRLAGSVPPGRVICSLDVAYFLMQRPEAPALHHVGWRALKGVGGGAPYPVLWLSQDSDRRPRHPWDDDSDGEQRRYLNSSPLQRNEFNALSRMYWSQLRDYFNRPYTSPEEITEEHHRLWQMIDDSRDDFDPIVLDEYRQH